MKFEVGDLVKFKVDTEENAKAFLVSKILREDASGCTIEILDDEGRLGNYNECYFDAKPIVVGDFVRFSTGPKNVAGEVCKVEEGFIDIKDKKGAVWEHQLTTDYRAVTSSEFGVGDIVVSKDDPHPQAGHMTVKGVEDNVAVVYVDRKGYHETCNVSSLRRIQIARPEFSRTPTEPVPQFKFGDWVRPCITWTLKDSQAYVCNVPHTPVNGETRIDVRSALGQIHSFQAKELILIPEAEVAPVALPPSDSQTLSVVLAEIRDVNSQVKVLRERQKELKSRARVLFQQALRAGTE